MKKDYPYNRTIYGKKEIKAVIDVLNSGGLLSGGEQTRLFEEELAQWWGVKYAIAVNSGSVANFIAVQALEIPAGSEVIVPAGGTFPTTISPLVYHGLVPSFIDIKLENLCLDPDFINGAITSKTKAIIIPHTLGFMPDMRALMKIIKAKKLKVMEDTCDAMGSAQDGKLAGTFGDLATASFYPAHLITTGGEGGAILTNDKSLYLACYSIRDWGRDCICQAERLSGGTPACGNRFNLIPGHDHRYYYSHLGLNCKMTEMQAAFGRLQLKRADIFIALRKRNYRILANRLGREFNYDITPFGFPVLTENRAEVMTRLQKIGVGVRTIFGGNILTHPAYKDIKCRINGQLRQSNILHKEGFFIGVGPHLSEKDISFVGESLQEILKTVPKTNPHKRGRKSKREASSIKSNLVIN
jgi:CDP-4-dehydro-6-deoxyglucose reductase, E1